jgi:formylglycine-generating enzyme required for sulfatase activity
MVLIPAGEFLMGDDASPFAPEKPAHIVHLDDYWIDRLEVTNAQYRLCVDDGGCEEPRAWLDENFNRDDQPAVVTWEGASEYCAWAGTRLPTEAEWEKAARGVDGRTWPWGNAFEEHAANLSGDADGYGFTAPVGSFPRDASPYGLLDVAGNAAEWVSDWFAVDTYARSAAENPTGPTSGEQKVHRAPIANAGGGPEKCRCTSRYGVDPNWTYGFRCASSASPID